MAANPLLDIPPQESSSGIQEFSSSSDTAPGVSASALNKANRVRLPAPPKPYARLASKIANPSGPRLNIKIQ